MARTRMEPQARRAALVDAATRLFAERGVDSTTVSDIVSAANVAQGTFYLYFQSKADVVNAVVQGISERIIADAVAIADAEDLPALAKLMRMRDSAMSALGPDAALLEFFHRSGNEPVHDRVSRDSMRLVVPAFEKVIVQGREEGVFHLSHPDDAARFIAALTDVTDPFDAFAEPERLSHHAEAITEFILRGLGCEEAVIEAELKAVRARERSKP